MRGGVWDRILFRRRGARALPDGIGPPSPSRPRTRPGSPWRQLCLIRRWQSETLRPGTALRMAAFLFWLQCIYRILRKRDA